MGGRIPYLDIRAQRRLIMAANGTTGYQGFRGFSLRPPPMLKPGETLESRRSKYLNSGNYPTSSASLSGKRDMTISVMMSQGLTLSDYHVPNPLGVSAAFSNKSPATKPCAGMTMSRHSYGRSKPDHAACSTFHHPKWSSSVTCDDLMVEHQTKSSYQMDMGMAGEYPSSRPFVAKTGMASTTMDLCDGSAKITYHVPGYSGHIPCSSRNHTVADHAVGAIARTKSSNLRFYHQHNLPGYTGYNPSIAKNDKGPRFSGSNPLTSSGAMTNGEVL